MNLLETIQDTLLMGPGPSCVSPEVYHAIARPTIGHLDPLFIRIMDEVKTNLRILMETENLLTLPVSGTGSAGMETCFVNLVEPGDNVLVLVNGVFGQRMTDVARRLGAKVDALEFEWGTPVDPQVVREQLEKHPYSIVACVHAETSTGVCNPVEEIGEAVRNYGALYLVDAVTSLGGMPVRTDRWRIDALYSGTQKCLSVPPGLAPITFSLKAIEKLQKRSSKVPNWYLDLSLIMNYWEGAKRSYHHTAPVNMIYALHQGLVNILKEGKEAVYTRHADAHAYLVKGFSDLGLELLVRKGARLPMLNAVKCPAGVDEASIRQRLLSEHAIEIGAGLGPLAGKVWRIGLMGHTARKENVDRLIGAIRSYL